MSRRASRRSGGLLIGLALLFPGCNKPADAPGTGTARTTRPVSTEPGEIELSEPKVTFTEPNRVQFEVKYRFVKGQPDKYYLCDISFPGTPNHGMKPMESWELKPEGVIKDGIVLSRPPVKTFEIKVSEATSPQDGYKKISNVAKGAVK
jgi:hypothetical protein